MSYAYMADIWCDSCARKIREDLERAGATDTGDTDDWPQWGPDEDTDGPQHCAARAECLEALDLRDYGLMDGAPLIGAESYAIGALIDGGLTEDGAAYLKEMLGEKARTDYQEALHRFWREAFADYL